MGSVTEIWSARRFKRGLCRHWVGFGDEILIKGGHAGEGGTLSIDRSDAGGPLRATLDVPPGRYTGKIARGGHLVIDIRALRLVVVVRAVEGARALLEFGVPRGNPVEIALGA